jgi:hypothetical protein
MLILAWHDLTAKPIWQPDAFLRLIGLMGDPRQPALALFT